jgi:hypothetical protein
MGAAHSDRKVTTSPETRLAGNATEGRMFDSLSAEEFQFIKAIEKFKSKTGKMFLSWTEVLKILKELGYKKVPVKKEKEKEKEKEKAAAK